MSYLGLKTWDLVWSDKSQLPFHALNGGDCMDWVQVTWDLGPLVNRPLNIVPVWTQALLGSSLHETEKVGEAMCVYGLCLFDDENIVPT